MTAREAAEPGSKSKNEFAGGMGLRKKLRLRRCLTDTAGLLVVALALGLASKWLHPRAPAWSIASGSQREELISLTGIDTDFGSEVLWLDARSAASFAAGHIPGALRIEMDDPGSWFYENFDSLVVETRPVVVYDGSPGAAVAMRAAAYLRANTRLNPVLVLEGGWSGWLKAGRTVQRH